MLTEWKETQTELGPGNDCRIILWKSTLGLQMIMVHNWSIKLPFSLQFEMFTSVMDYMMERVKSVSLMDPDILQILEIFLYFSKNPILAKVNWLMSYYFSKDLSMVKTKYIFFCSFFYLHDWQNVIKYKHAFYGRQYADPFYEQDIILFSIIQGCLYVSIPVKILFTGAYFIK